MTLSDALKATVRSLQLIAIRAGVRVGALVTPVRTAEIIAHRFFITQKPARERTVFNVIRPTCDAVHTPDGEVATYRWGDVGKQPTVVLVHGWNGWARQLEPFVERLQQRGYAVLAFDHVAHGASPGNRSSMPVMIRTVEHVLNTVPNVAGVIAHSLGAAAVASVLASSRRELHGAVLIAPPSDPRPYLSMLARMLGAPRKLQSLIQQAAERIAGIEFKRLVAEPWLVRRIRTPLMVVHDVGDEEVPISNGYAYTTGSQVRVLATDGLGHRRILRDLHVVETATEFVAPGQPASSERLAA